MRVHKHSTITLIGLAGAIYYSGVLIAADFFTDPLAVMPGSSAVSDGDTLSVDCLSFHDLPDPLYLFDAVEYTLCKNPKAKIAWSNTKAQAATLGIGRSSYLPKMDVYTSINQAHHRSTFSNDDFYNTDVSGTEFNNNVTLSWVIYDFGLRAANLDSAQLMLESALSGQNDVLLTIFFQTAQIYYQAQATKALLTVAKEAESAAEQSLKAAEAKYHVGVGTLADQLQAKTAHAEAVSRRVQVEGDVQNALGSLSILMGMPPYTRINIDNIKEENLENRPFREDVEKLIEQALREHPKLLGARAQLKAVEAHIEAIKAQGYPTLSLKASADYFNTSATPINNQGASEQTLSSQGIGFQLNIPLFEGFGRTYKVAEAIYQSESKKAELESIEQEIALLVWKNYQALCTGMESFKAVKVLNASAKQGYEVSLGRYKSGVGNMLELLKAQSDLTNARQQYLLAITNLQKNRIALLTSLGVMDLDAIH